jgi:hypothetical protein
MKKIAVDKARDRLRKAGTILRRVADTKTFPEFQSAWTDFLIALNTITFVLEKGASSNAQSRQWYGGKKKIGRKDPLLRYLHQARNADEHGLEPVAEHRPGHIAIGVGGESVHIRSLTFSAGQITGSFDPVDGKLPTIHVAAPHVALITVSDDRHGEKFDPPKEHLGETFLDTSPTHPP